jgi:glycosyltransferase involved in cell wall biosynthesis
MRVAQIIDALKPGGGAERLQLSFAEAVQRRPVELSVLTLGDNDPGMTAQLAELGVEVHAFPSGSFADPVRAVRLLRFVRAGGFDLLHTHLVRSTLLGGLVGRLCGVPVVSTIHNTRHNRRLPRVLRWAEGRTLRSDVARVIAVGWQTAEVHAERLHPRSIDVIPNAVPRFDPGWAGERERVRRELGASEGDTVLVSVGRLHPQKGYPDLIEAFRRLRQERGRRDLRLWVVGCGPLRAELDRAVADPELEGRVRLLGLRKDVPRLLAGSDLYVSAARWEGLPVSILEAMSAARPIVATAVGDVPRIVDGRNGRLVPPGEPEALAAALDEALSDPKRLLAWGEGGARRVHAEFGLATWADRILSLYDEVIGESGGRRASLPAAERRSVECG